MFPELSKLLECPICFNTLSLPVAWCQRNGHTICKACKAFIPSCPYCKSQWSVMRHILLDQILQNLLQQCRYCQEVVDIEMLYDHERKFCKKKKMQCFIFSRGGRCIDVFLKESLLDHLYDRHGRKMWMIFLGETVDVPIKNVFLSKNFCVLYEVGLPFGRNTDLHILLRLFGDKPKKFLCFSVNIIQDGDRVDQYVYTFSIRYNGIIIHSYVGPCIPTFDIPEPPDRYPGGHRYGRITLSRDSTIFTNLDPRSLTFQLRIETP